MGVVRVALLALTVGIAAERGASAHGDYPMPHQVIYHPTDESKMAIGTNFGLLVSSDAGTTWQWICEGPYLMGVLYYLPSYAYTPSGALLATTPAGLWASRDAGCNWSPVAGPLGGAFPIGIQNGPDGSIWAPTQTTGAPNDLYVSRDDGVTFMPVGPAHDNAVWHSLRVASSDPMRVYLSGHEAPSGDASPTRFLFYRSNDGAVTWSGGLVPLPYGEIYRFQILAVSPTNPDLVFARANRFESDVLLRSEDGGTTWANVLTLGLDVSAVVIKADGQTAITGSPQDGTYISTDAGLTWDQAGDSPHMGCATRRGSDDSYVGCGVLPDDYVLAHSQDGVSWTPMLRFCDVTGPVECPSDSPFGATCPTEWAMISPFFQAVCNGTPLGDGGMMDGGGGGGGGGCGCGVALGLVLVVPPSFRRRRAPRD